MTSRMHAPHTTCPGCREEVYLDELVKGRCPLCGCTLEEFEEAGTDIEELIDRTDFSWLVFNYFIFKKFIEMGASPLRVMQLISGYEEICQQTGGDCADTRFELELPRSSWDRVRPKRCSRCGRFYFRGGKKLISGDLAVPGYLYSYCCGDC